MQNCLSAGLREWAAFQKYICTSFSTQRFRWEPAEVLGGVWAGQLPAKCVLYTFYIGNNTPTSPWLHCNSEHGSAGWVVGLDDLGVLLKPQRFCDSGKDIKIKYWCGCFDVDTSCQAPLWTEPQSVSFSPFWSQSNPIPTPRAGISLGIPTVPSSVWEYLT